MNQLPPFDSQAERIRATAEAFPYPPTPDIAAALRQRRTVERERPARPRRTALVWTAAALVLVLLGMLAVPDVRASIRAFLRIGAVEIVPLTPTPTASPGTTTTTITPTLVPRTSVLDLQGATTLDAATQRMPFPLRLPAYPADLGPPDRVFVQSMGGPVAILVWLQPDQPTHARLALYQLSSAAIAQKFAPKIVQHTTVHGQPALWLEGPHLLQFRSPDDFDLGRLVEGNVLLWTENDVTYRLEAGLSLDEAVRIAESLR